LPPASASLLYKCMVGTAIELLIRGNCAAEPAPQRLVSRNIVR